MAHAKNQFWHIDYFLGLKSVRILEVFDKIDERIADCKIAGCLAENGFSIERFGAPDCSCGSHLFRLRDYEFLRRFMQELPELTSRKHR